MRPRLTPAVLLAGLLTSPALAAPKPTTVGWKTTVLDAAFRSEGVAIADVNRDGKADILAGDYWYEAPAWTPREIRPPGNFGDGSGGYSQSFACWADDFNADGWQDVIVVGFPGEPCRWYENPQNATGHWKAHEIWHSACNETPLYTDLLGTGKRVLVMAWQPKGQEHMGQMAYFRPASDPNALWEMRPVSEPSAPGKEIPGTFKYSHGLGTSDVNGDGRADVIVPQGWWEQPASDSGTPWAWHPAPLGEACADMFTLDLDGDGRNDVLSSAAHMVGIWAHARKGDSFATAALFPRLVSQTHAMHLVDINGDGLKDLVTGKRWWAHGPRGDFEPNAPAVLYWFEASKVDGQVRFTPRVVHGHGGIGTQFAVGDIDGDGRPDIATSNKLGVRVHLQTVLPTPTLSPADAAAAEGYRPLFNGVNLQGWDTPTAAVFSIASVDGEPAIRVGPEATAALTTQSEHENYRVRFQYKYGAAPEGGKKRNSGLIYHCFGAPNAAGGAFHFGGESQLHEGQAGDFWCVGPLTAVVVRGDATTPLPGGRAEKFADAEKPGEWNTMEVVLKGDTAEHIVNGKTVMVMRELRRKEGDKLVPLTKGKFQFQAEGAELFLRRIEVRN